MSCEFVSNEVIMINQSKNLTTDRNMASKRESVCACMCASVCECVCMCLTSASVIVKWFNSKCLRLDSNNTLLLKETTSMLTDYLLYQNDYAYRYAEQYNSGNWYVNTNWYVDTMHIIYVYF